MTKLLKFLVSIFLVEAVAAFMPSLSRGQQTKKAQNGRLMGAYDFANQPLGGKGIDDRLCEQLESAKAMSNDSKMYGVLSTSQLQAGQSKMEQKALQQDYHPGEQQQGALPFRPFTAPNTSTNNIVEEN